MSYETLREVVAWLDLVLQPASACLCALVIVRFLPVERLWRRVLLTIAMVLPVNQVIWIGDPLGILASGVVFFAAVLLLCGGPVLARMSMGIILFSVMVSSQAVFCSIRPPLDFLMHGYTCILWGAIYLFVRRLAATELIRSPRLWLLVDALALMPFGATVIIVALSRQEYAHDTPDTWTDTLVLPNERVLVSVLVLAALCALVLLVTVIVLARHEALERQQMLWQVRQQYYSSLEQNQTQVRRLRHDMANHLSAMAGMEDAAMRTYLAGLLGAPAMAGGRRFCRNPVVNAVLAAKMPVIEEEGIKAEIEVSLPEALALPEMELCALFGNCLDNAIEACRKCEGQARTLSLKAGADKGLFVLHLENSMEGVLVFKNGRPATTKADKSLHGFGLAGIEETVRRFGGMMVCEQAGRVFRMRLSMPLAAGAHT